MPLHLLAQLEAKPGQAAALAALLHTLVAATRQESACLQYDLWQASDQPNSFVMVERWRDQPGVDSHGQTSHFQAFLRASAGLLAQPMAVKHYRPTS